MMNGYILISRAIVESEIWNKPPLYLKVWIWILCNAQFKKYKNLERGQLFTNIEEIRQACSHYVGYRKEIPTKKQIYTILRWLRNPHEGDNERDTKGNMVETTAVTHGIVLTVCNFNKYQDHKSYEGNDERDNEGIANGTRREQEGKDINEYKGIQENTRKINNIYPALGEFENVLLTEEELEKLKKQFPYDWQQRIENLSQYMKSKGRRYKSHYATILTWARKEERDAAKKQNERAPKSGGEAEKRDYSDSNGIRFD